MRSLYWANARGRMYVPVMGIRHVCRRCKYKKTFDLAEH